MESTLPDHSGSAVQVLENRQRPDPARLWSRCARSTWSWRRGEGKKAQAKNRHTRPMANTPGSLLCIPQPPEFGAMLLRLDAAGQAVPRCGALCWQLPALSN